MSDRLSEIENWVQSTTISRRGAILCSVAASAYALAVQPVEAAITTPADGLDAGWVKFPTGGISMGGYRAKPKGKTKLPTIIVVQEIFGVHAWVQDVVRRFAKAGFYAVAPDLYQRQGDATKVADIPTLFTTIVAKVPDAQVMGDLDALSAFVGKDGGDAARLGITGFCWGGRIVWLYAAHSPKVKAGVAFYGKLTGKPNPLQPKNPIELVSAIKAPVLGMYGALDKGIPATDVEAMNAALKAAGKPSSLNLYPGADHGFMADYRPSYNEPAAADAWRKTVGHFKRSL